MDNRMRAGLAAFLAATGAPGVTASVVRGNGVLQNFAAGVADVDTAAVMTPAHRMLAGSTGKTLTAATALVLAQRGVLDLDAPVSRWLSDRDWLPHLANSRTATVRSLLNHTSGIPDHRAAPGFLDTLKRELPRNPDLYLSPEALIGFVAGMPPHAAVGRGFLYSETNYIVAGLVIEAAAARPLYDMIREYFLLPFELADTEPAIRRELTGLATGYAAGHGIGCPPVTLVAGRLAYNPASEWAGGGFVSTAADLARWAHAYFRGRVLPASCLSALLSARTIERDPDLTTAYGLGCYIWDGAHGRAIGHSGEAPGYRSAMAFFEEADATLAVQVNSSIVDAVSVTGLMLRMGGLLRD